LKQKAKEKKLFS